MGNDMGTRPSQQIASCLLEDTDLLPCVCLWGIQAGCLGFYFCISAR